MPDRYEDPSGVAAAVTSIVSALFAVAVAFGAPLTGQQQAALLSLALVVAPWITQAWVRRYAWSPEAHQRQVEQAREEGRLRGKATTTERATLWRQG